MTLRVTTLKRFLANTTLALFMVMAEHFERMLKLALALAWNKLFVRQVIRRHPLRQPSVSPCTPRHSRRP